MLRTVEPASGFGPVCVRYEMKNSMKFNNKSRAGPCRRLAGYLMKTDFVRSAVAQNADLAIFRQKPSARVVFGVIFIIASYLLCWPVIGIFGLLAISAGQPLWVVLGGPVTWAVSHLVCMFGLYLAGMEHSKALLKWLARLFVQRHLPEHAAAPDAPGVSVSSEK